MYKEVDTKLYVTCRLCLDEMGHYQIIPKIQQQIKFCFDINVHPLDALPQLICKKCESILSNFEEKKKIYQRRQVLLIENAKVNAVVSTSSQEQDTVSSTQLTGTEATEKKALKLRLKKTKVIPGPNSVDSDTFVIKEKQDRPLRVWRKRYNKLFACRFCTKEFRNKSSVLAHLTKHTSLLNNFSSSVKDCHIILARIDEKTNFVNDNSLVVVDEEKILQNKYLHYRVEYRRKVDKAKTVASASSDDDIGSNSKVKRLRLVSRSSNETVVLEDANKLKDNSELPCSNVGMNNYLDLIEIQSSPETVKSNDSATNPNIDLKHDISGIISSCYKKYLNKDNPSLNNTKLSQLHHKVLSMGRKVVNNKPFNCNGLLRYMEFKSLDIEWLEKSGPKLDSENINIRIRLQENKKGNYEIGWKLATELKGSDTDAYKASLDRILNKKDDCNSNGNTIVPTQLPKQLTEVSVTNEGNGGKLLNTNPVANPKQLPKKTHAKSASGCQKQDPVVNSVADNTEASIPAETVSLANIEESANNAMVSNKKAEKPFVPRIKVKSMSQLTADKNALPSVSSVSLQVAWNVPEVQVPPVAQEPSEAVVMHTVELPNTRTLSPFKYFQNQLHMHGIVLLSSIGEVPMDFFCLIKFKSLFRQEEKRVTLSLFLFSNSKHYYIRVMDSTGYHLDVSSLNPTWQWEILSLYREDISVNIIENAKKISAPMYQSANLFINLLRSIKKLT